MTAPGGPEHTPPSAAPVARAPWKRWLPVAVLVAVAALVVQQGWLDYLSLSGIAENRDWLVGFVAENRLRAYGFYALAYVCVVALSLPGGAILTLLGGFLFGWFFGGVITVVAATGGATIVFLIARTSLGETLKNRAGPWLSRLRDGIARDGISYLLFLRLVPAFPFWLVNIAPAVLGMSLGPYVLATFIGIIPGTFAFAFVGAGLDSVIEAQSASYTDCLNGRTPETAQDCVFTVSPGSLLTPELIAAFVALGLVALIPVALKRMGRRGRKIGPAD